MRNNTNQTRAPIFANFGKGGLVSGGTVWKAAAYVRLSRDDGDKEESDSVVNQKELIQSYISKKQDIELAADPYVEMNISKMIQFENMNPARKGRNKGFWHIRCCQKPLFFCALEWMYKNENPKVNPPSMASNPLNFN